MGLNEADTRAKRIDPALFQRGWTESHIKREETAGAIEIINGQPQRRPHGRIDYTLRIKVNTETQPVAVGLIEAKAERLAPNHGMEQAKRYGRWHNVPFIFTTNGDMFAEYDALKDYTHPPRPLSEFPTPDDLRRRYEQGKGFSLDSPAARPLLTRYTGGEQTRRYYQDAAIRAVLEKIAVCEARNEPRRALLSLATGAGKTFIAVHLLRRIADAGQLRKALFVCDRDELRTQAVRALQNVFGADAAEVTTNNPQKNARVLIVTYQTLGVDSDEADSFLTRHYPENYFSHIVIDECHRSAWGKWSQVLTRNPSAVQIGLTATPRQLDINEDTDEARADLQITADNVRYFGEPVYEYDLSQGIEDGYLAACEIRRNRVNIDDTGITIDDIMAHNPTDARTGEPVSREQLQEMYDKNDYEDRLLLPDRVLAMCDDLFRYLLETGGPYQKTIIFCVRDRHADDVAAAMNNLYAAWYKREGLEQCQPYAFKCTAAGGKEDISNLRGASRSHYVATTVDLLTTGVDVPAVENVVFFRYMKSPISFYQMVGRGTRLDLARNKLMFRVYDYTNATRLFGQEFVTKGRGNTTDGPPPETPNPADPQPERPPMLSVQVEGFPGVQVTPDGRFILSMIDGKAMPIPVAEYMQKLRDKVHEEAPDLNSLRSFWVVREQRLDLLGRLPDGGQSVGVVRVLRKMLEYDLYDVLADLTYKQHPFTRDERAQRFTTAQAAWLQGLSPKTVATIQAIVSQFARSGIDGLESRYIFQTPEVQSAGGMNALKELGKPVDVLREIKERLLAA